MVGLGYDVHRLAAGRQLILAGVIIPADKGCVAHSDGDVVYHALTDALLGAIADGDIGEHFPDTDSRWRDASSETFVRFAVERISERGCYIVNIDVAVVLELPKLAPYKNQMRDNIAEVCEISPEKVGLKATTSERLGFVGTGDGIQAWCICEIQSLY